ncbi:hypothetical protein [Frankia sp. Cr1]|uniref:hypothetical protein n=1 Tax=Frankia sp. Cr1 TaxID=3073931 RepID=UPI002AD3B495|nr:hypothetical protein [Frankia sp. Cr1]
MFSMPACGKATVSFGQLDLIDTKPPARRPAPLLRTAAPTFGVFRYGGVGGRPPIAARPGSFAPRFSPLAIPDNAPAVLVCANAFDRLTTDLSAEGLSAEKARERAGSFLTSTLVHEHTHAVLATGLDQQGLVAATVGTRLWSTGRKLNEALTAWTQRHFHRDNPAAFKECTRYIETDDYPAWPYRGAATLERLFADDGLAAIRRFVRMLREAPDIAQREFHALVRT